MHIIHTNPETLSRHPAVATLPHHYHLPREADLTGAREEREGARNIHTLPKEYSMTFK